MARKRVSDELGAHVSSAGGVQNAPARAAELGAVVLQLFTKQPSRWAEPELSHERATAFLAARADHGIVAAAAHDSYLINLATADQRLAAMSYHSFREELRRCAALGLEFLVTHPGNATDGDVPSAVARNAEQIERALEEVDGKITVLLEGTAGAGRALGSTFEQLAAIRERIRHPLRQRVAFCLDTCHLWAAGYDLREDYDGVIRGFDDAIGLHLLRFLHLNDSQGERGSRRDRHAAIGEGALGPEPFRRLMNDDRLRGVPKVLETPKGEDAVREDRRNLRRLRGYRR